MRKVLFAAIALALTATAASAQQAPTAGYHWYKDTQGNVWAINGPAVGRWRPFPDAAQNCPTLHIRAEKVKDGAGGYKWTPEDRARNRHTMHMVCIEDVPAPRPPAHVARQLGIAPAAPPPRAPAIEREAAPPREAAPAPQERGAGYRQPPVRRPPPQEVHRHRYNDPVPVDQAGEEGDYYTRPLYDGEERM